MVQCGCRGGSTRSDVSWRHRVLRQRRTRGLCLTHERAVPCVPTTQWLSTDLRARLRRSSVNKDSIPTLRQETTTLLGEMRNAHGHGEPSRVIEAANRLLAIDAESMEARWYRRNAENRMTPPSHTRGGSVVSTSHVSVSRAPNRESGPQLSLVLPDVWLRQSRSALKVSGSWLELDYCLSLSSRSRGGSVTLGISLYRLERIDIKALQRFARPYSKTKRRSSFTYRQRPLRRNTLQSIACYPKTSWPGTRRPSAFSGAISCPIQESCRLAPLET